MLAGVFLEVEFLVTLENCGLLSQWPYFTSALLLFLHDLVNTAG